MAWLWWGAASEAAAGPLQEKRDQVLTFLENELDSPATSAHVEEACII